jgi:alpha-N-acetylglucosaminidase
MASRLFFIITVSLLLTFQNGSAQSGVQNSTVNKKPIYEFIKRIIGNDAKHFKVEIIPQEENKDVFELESNGSEIILRGNNGISIASALNYYLKKYAHCSVNWNGSNLNLPHPLPVITKKNHQTSPYKYRYYFNYCTFNYTASWWDWDRWQKEIDFMALNGINMPLALTGQNAIWKRVYKNIGFTDKELEGFFSGPAYFSWFWMGNLDGYGGPLPDSWMKSHEELQKKILLRERELGMTPVLPAFTGHVPPSFKEKFPQTNVIQTIWDAKDFNPVYTIDPIDTMFTYIGKKFLVEQTKTYGTDHLYSSDTFNENEPPSNDSTFLKEISEKVYSSMEQVDSQAKWVMQGWLFYSHAKFWEPTQIKALLNAIPNDKMIILDLWSEKNPQWQKMEAYYGKSWIWCMLHNFGGKINMFGDIEHLANGPIETLKDPNSGNMIGIGVTAEGLEQNPVVYSVMLENAWRNEKIDPAQWLQEYVYSRYGKRNVNAEKAWQVLLETVYNERNDFGTKAIVTIRPELDDNTTSPVSYLNFKYNTADLLPAWNDLLTASGYLKNKDGFNYDLVDVSRQVLVNYSNVLYKKLNEAYYEKDVEKVKEYGNRILEVVDDMDVLLATRKDFLLGKWLNDAKKCATNENEKMLYEKNARNLITLWGTKVNTTLYDYARKQWSGLIKDFYKPRLQKFFFSLIGSLEKKQKFNQKSYDNEIANWEWNWVNENKCYPDKSVGNSVAVSKKLFEKYSKIINETFNNQLEEN